MRVGVVGLGRIGPFHAQSLAALGHDVVVTDLRVDLAEATAREHGYDVAADVPTLLGEVDTLVIATDTASHAVLLQEAVAAGVPTFCEKPVAATLDETIDLVAMVEASGVPVQVGFQRRFDVGFLRARAAVASGELGFVHSVRSTTHDQSPPHPDYLPTSGGIFRDCNIHDFDVIRYVTGHEVSEVYAVGANKGAAFFAEAGDADTGAALLTLDDGTLATVTATRYNGAGHDVRLEVLGRRGRSGSATTTRSRSPPQSPASTIRGGRGWRRSSNGSGRRTRPRWRRSARWRAPERRRPARSRTRSQPSGSPRRPSAAGSPGDRWRWRTSRHERAVGRVHGTRPGGRRAAARALRSRAAGAPPPAHR